MAIPGQTITGYLPSVSAAIPSSRPTAIPLTMRTVCRLVLQVLRPLLRFVVVRLQSTRAYCQQLCPAIHRSPQRSPRVRPLHPRQLRQLRQTRPARPAHLSIAQSLPASPYGGGERPFQTTVIEVTAPIFGHTVLPTTQRTGLRSSSNRVSPTIVTIFEKLVLEEHLSTHPRHERHVGFDRQYEHDQR